jgi:two-component system response regulator HydG
VGPNILVVDDEETNRLTLERILVREGMRVRHAANGQAALVCIREDRPDLVLTDLKMPKMDGMQLMRAAHELYPDLEFVLMTAYGTVETAVSAMKEGAYDFVTKPLRRTELVHTVNNAIEKGALVRENRSLKSQLAQRRDDTIIGHSSSMLAVIEEARQVADSMASVLITGESGTGKGVLARFLHGTSPRAAGPLITVNCGALPDNLLESELFGYEKGAFTGANTRKQGRFDTAKTGTLFLDEITEMAPAVQAKLLRVLQDGQYERLGGNKTLQSDARILAATNIDPDGAVKEGMLREDLFYRLDVIRLALPPLRERQEDIPMLARHFVTRSNQRHGRNITAIDPAAIAALQGWKWPGNVRELENAIERAVVLCRKDTITIEDLPPSLVEHRSEPTRLSFEVGSPLEFVERRMIEATLKRVGGDKIRAAELLGVTSRTLYRRLAEWRE